MRSVLAVIYVFFFLVFNLPVMGVLWIVGRFNKEKSDLAELHIVQHAFRCVMFLSGVKLEVYGRELIPDDEPVLYIGNHRSIFDVVCTYPLVKNRCGYVAKDTVNHVPILGMVMRRLYCLFMKRDDMRQSMKVILDAIQYMKDGISITIFPEGTRCKDENPRAMLPYKDGSFKIATKSKRKIVPMAITGTRDILESHFPWIHKGKVTVTFGEPIDPEKLDKEELKNIGEYVHNVVEKMLCEAYDKLEA